MVKNPPAKQEMWIQSLGQEDPLEKEMATHSSILAGEIPWTEEPGGLQSMGSPRAGHDSATNTFTFLQDISFWSTHHTTVRLCAWLFRSLLRLSPIL